ncbi:hypothetical protein TrVE_jg5013 [Triparma verrucosa]|uniref:Tyrosine-protein kinase ephrin type A/B receptor-like domain-containing protein n=1 Tax=Triparma verrucosa TaxID=1606542 RepID=A0A9W7BRI1_9STRA|nr:hypothetical protein TrVE_jg5013 [Triparma verrucosa]
MKGVEWGGVFIFFLLSVCRGVIGAEEGGKYSSTPSATSADTCLACVEGKESSNCACGLGAGGDLSGPTSPATGQLQDASSVRIRDSSNISPTFDSEGVVTGRIEFSDSISTRGCSSCPAGHYSSATGATSSNTCQACEAGKASSSRGAPSESSCELCGPGLSSNGAICKICDADEFSDGKTCHKCDSNSSWVIIVLSILSFLVVGWYVGRISASRQRMIRLKVITTFFQTAELTTAIKIGWPSFVTWSIPFNIPVADAECATQTFEGWNIYSTYLVSIYLPVVVFLGLLRRIRSLPSRSTMREKLSSTLVFLLVIWYLPIVRLSFQMFPCVDNPNYDGDGFWDEDRSWDSYPSVLVADPKVECDLSNGYRTLILVQASLTIALVGIGFPVFIVRKLRALHATEMLTAESSYVSLFQWYEPKAAWFEAVHMVRKALLILSTVFLPSTSLEAALSLVINLTFLAILVRTEPLVFYPCSLFPGKNLFLLSEVLIAATTVFGSFLALVGSLSGSTSAVNVLGVIFVSVNSSFAAAFMWGYHLDINQRDKLFPVARHESTALRSDSVNRKIAGTVKANEKEWDDMVELVEAADNSGLKKKLIGSLPFARSQAQACVRIEMKELDERLRKDITALSESFGKSLELKLEDINQKLSTMQPTVVLAEYRIFLRRVEASYARFTGSETYDPSSDPLREIALNEDLQICLVFLEKMGPSDVENVGDEDGVQMVRLSKNPTVTETRRGVIILDEEFKLRFSSADGLDAEVQSVSESSEKFSRGSSSLSSEFELLNRNSREYDSSEVSRRSSLLKSMTKSLSAIEKGIAAQMVDVKAQMADVKEAKKNIIDLCKRAEKAEKAENEEERRGLLEQSEGVPTGVSNPAAGSLGGKGSKGSKGGDESRGGVESSNAGRPNSSFDAFKNPNLVLGGKGGSKKNVGKARDDDQAE